MMSGHDQEERDPLMDAEDERWEPEGDTSEEQPAYAHGAAAPEPTPGAAAEAIEIARKAAQWRRRILALKKIKALLVALKASLPALGIALVATLGVLALIVILTIFLHGFTFFGADEMGADPRDPAALSSQEKLAQALEAARNPGELCAVLEQNSDILADISSPAQVMLIYCQIWDATNPESGVWDPESPEGAVWFGVSEIKLNLIQSNPRPVYRDVENLEPMSIFAARGFDLFDLYAVHFEFWQTCTDPKTGAEIPECGLMYFDAEKSLDPNDPAAQAEWAERRALIASRVEEDMRYIAHLLGQTKLIPMTFYLERTCEVLEGTSVDSDALEPPAPGCPGVENGEYELSGKSDEVRAAEAAYEICLADASLDETDDLDPADCHMPPTTEVFYYLVDPFHTELEVYLYTKEEVIRLYARERGGVDPGAGASPPAGFQPVASPYAREIQQALERVGLDLQGANLSAAELLSRMIYALSYNDRRAGAHAPGFSCLAAGLTGADCWDALAAQSGVPGPALPADPAANPYRGRQVPSMRLGLSQLTTAETLSGMRICGTGDYFRRQWDDPATAICSMAVRLKELWRSPHLPEDLDISLRLLAYLDGEVLIQQLIAGYPGVQNARDLRQRLQADRGAYCGEADLPSCRSWMVVENVVGLDGAAGTGTSAGSAGIVLAPEYQRYLQARELILGMFGMPDTGTPIILTGDQISAQFLAIPDLGKPLQLSPDDLFGYRLHPIHGDLRMHWGVDLAVPMGTDVLAMGDPGTEIEVIQVGSDATCGGLVMYRTVLKGTPLTVRYCHLSTHLTHAGATAVPGQVLALSGGAPWHPLSGLSTGPHLHIEVYVNGAAVDPLPYIVR